MRWLTVLIVCTLVGCASGPDRQAQLREAAEAASLQWARDWAECDRLYPDKYRKPVTPRIKCQAAAVDKYSAAWKQATGSAPLDIHAKHNAQMLVAAERFDKGELSKAEYDLALANGAAAVAAQQQAAAAASQAAIQAATPPRTRRTNCNTYWGTVNCTTY